MNLARYTGYLIALTGLLQLIITFIADWPYIQYMLKSAEWLAASFYHHSLHLLWNSITAITWIIGGITLQAIIKQTQKPLPMFLGWTMIIFAIFLLPLVPVSAVWAFLVIGALIIRYRD